MEIRETSLEGVLVVAANIYKDSRGHFLETYHATRYAEGGVGRIFLQDNLSYSRKGVLRGLHFQHPNDQAKLVGTAYGAIFDVAVDIRLGSPTYAQWFGEMLTSENGQQLYIPEGYAHGFVVLSDFAVVTYKCSELYAPKCETSLLWNDPDIGIEWPEVDVTISERDAAALRLSEIPQDRLPRYEPDTDWPTSGK